jgi:hypothetical protein
MFSENSHISFYKNNPGNRKGDREKSGFRLEQEAESYRSEPEVFVPHQAFKPIIPQAPECDRFRQVF